MHQKNLADLYGLDPIPWSRALKALDSDEPEKNDTWFLATTRPDGRPHVAGVGAVWDNGKVYVVSGERTRKSQNLAQNPNCAVGISKPGIDLVIEGTAERVTDDATLQRLAKRYADGGWAPNVKDGAFTPRIQCAERRSSAVVLVRDHADHDLRRAGTGTGWRHPLALRRLTGHAAAPIA